VPARLEQTPAAGAQLAEIEKQLAGQGIAVRSVVESGQICERILQAVEDHKGDLLVLGTKARAELGHAALGRVARRLLATSRCPVLTVPAEAGDSLEQAGDWRRVLVATDFSAISLAALRFASRIARREMRVVHATRSERLEDQSRFREKLRFLAPLNESHTLPVEHVVCRQDPSQCIIEQAQSFHADLVVLGAPLEELTPERFEQSTVMQVISALGCPVLCVRSRAASAGSKRAAELAAV
jgi:nucleotide-binding universal stress UspA family protein